MKSLLLIAMVLTAPNAFASEKLQTIQLNDMTYEEVKTLVRKETNKCYAQANEAEKASATSIDDIDQFVGEEQSPELVACLTKVSGLILARRDQNDRVTELFQKSLLEINQEQRKSAYKKILEAAVTEYKLLRQKMRDASASLRKTIVADLATTYEQIFNTLSELKPLLVKEKSEAKPLFEIVGKADISVDDELKNFRVNRGSGVTLNLSERAQEILASAE